GNITAETIKAVITPRSRAIIAVHLAGWPCDMDPIMELAEVKELKVIEDCAQAHGTRYKGRAVGGIGHVGAWSFCQDKIMTTGGEGGMVTCNDEALWRRMWAFKDHGKSYEAVYERKHPPGYRWLHEDFGTNWRMTEIQGVLGRIQLGRMADWTEARTRNAQVITDALLPFSGTEGPVRLPDLHCAGYAGPISDNGTLHGFYKYYAYVRADNLAAGWDRDQISNEINARGVPCFQGTCSEMYLE
ncbi:MAG: DegT/DnrJ/EryC1/StrS aminotransferase family protein, partial [Alloalcanivorax venustensis]|uniref:DegT/DnrJ/EryC1/StrS family aminotransferase n=1 Tax=Alloalcanivorax venustensis TaxID=172371 RepID=UPI003001D45A